MNKASETCWTLIKESTLFASSESQKEARKENRIEKVLKEIMARNSPKLAKHNIRSKKLGRH